MKYEIGNKIRYFREKRGFTQKELANSIGVSNSRVSNWEQGINRPDADILIMLCRALGVSADELLDINLSNLEGVEDKEDTRHLSDIHSKVMFQLEKMPDDQIKAVLAFIDSLDKVEASFRAEGNSGNINSQITE